MTDLTITSMAHSSSGITHLDSRVVFVRRAFPGDIVELDTKKIEWHKKFGLAKDYKLKQEGPARCSSPCPYTASCGGCHWLGSKVSEQRAWKRDYLQHTLGSVLAPGLGVSKLVASKLELGYRRRIQLRGRVKGNRLALGFFAENSHELQAVSQCLAASECIQRLIRDLNTSYTPMDKTCYQEAISFRLQIDDAPAASAHEASLMVLVITDNTQDQNKDLKKLSKNLAENPKVFWSGFRGADLPAQPILWDKDQGIDYYSYPGQFQQVNHESNRMLRQYVGEHVAKLRPKRILDLYSGSGNLSCGLGGLTDEVIAVEGSSLAVKTGLYNARSNKLRHIRFVCENAESFVQRYRADLDLIILDPPRAGAKEIAKILCQKDKKPMHIIYVSCNPSTLGRDLRTLSAEYQIKEVCAFDFFPNTYHFETVCILTRR